MPPQNLDSEQAVLGSILIDRDDHRGRRLPARRGLSTAGLTAASSRDAAAVREARAYRRRHRGRGPRARRGVEAVGGAGYLSPSARHAHGVHVASTDGSSSARPSCGVSSRPPARSPRSATRTAPTYRSRSIERRQSSSRQPASDDRRIQPASDTPPRRLRPAGLPARHRARSSASPRDSPTWIS